MQVNSGVSGGGDAFQCKVFVTLCKGGVFHLKLNHMLYLHVWWFTCKLRLWCCSTIK